MPDRVLLLGGAGSGRVVETYCAPGDSINFLCPPVRKRIERYETYTVVTVTLGSRAFKVGVLREMSASDRDAALQSYMSRAWATMLASLVEKKEIQS